MDDDDMKKLLRYIDLSAAIEAAMAVGRRLPGCMYAERAELRDDLYMED